MSPSVEQLVLPRPLRCSRSSARFLRSASTVQTCARATHFEPLLPSVLQTRLVVTPPAKIVIAQPYAMTRYRSLCRRVSRRLFCPPAPGRTSDKSSRYPLHLRQKYPDTRPQTALRAHHLQLKRVPRIRRRYHLRQSHAQAKPCACARMPGLLLARAPSTCSCSKAALQPHVQEKPSRRPAGGTLRTYSAR